MAPLIQGVEFGGLIADRAFDANWILADLDERGAKRWSPHTARTVAAVLSD